MLLNFRQNNKECLHLLKCGYRRTFLELDVLVHRQLLLNYISMFIASYTLAITLFVFSKFLSCLIANLSIFLSG